MGAKSAPISGDAGEQSRVLEIEVTYRTNGKSSKNRVYIGAFFFADFCRPCSSQAHFSAPSNVRRKLMTAPLSAELKNKYGVSRALLGSETWRRPHCY